VDIKIMNHLLRINKILTSFFAVWVIIISVLAYFFPTIFLTVKPYIPLLLGIIMFGMGMTLKINDVKIAFVKPVAMTTVSTLLSPILTPCLTLLYARQWIPIDPANLFLSILKMVLIPIILGLLVKRFLPKFADKSGNLTPSVSVLAIMAIIACVVALNVKNIVTMGAVILMAVILHNLLGLLSGYTIAYLFKQNKKNCRAISIEVGMQNSGLGAALAHTYFSPATALPSAIFSIWHNISGAILASIWSRKR